MTLDWGERHLDTICALGGECHLNSDGVIDSVELLCPMIQDNGSYFKAQSLGLTGTRRGIA